MTDKYKLAREHLTSRLESSRLLVKGYSADVDNYTRKRNEAVSLVNQIEAELEGLGQ